MSFRTWLLTGTSLGFLALAPFGAAQAQDAALVAAYQAYVSAQTSGDAAALETARAALNEQCIVAGFATFEDCVAALEVQVGVSATPPAAEAPASSEEATPPAAETPPPAEEVAPPPAEEPPPAAESAASSEEAAPAPSAAEEPPAAVEAPSSEEAAPASSEQPSAVADPNADILAQLQASVALYNEGISDLDAGNAEGQAKVDQALAQIDATCTAGGYADRNTCLAAFNIELLPLPPTAVPPATEPSSEPPPVADLPGADQAVTDEATEALPADVPPEEAAPVLDSAKDDENVTKEGKPPAEETPPPAEPPAPPPADDQAAQADIAPPPAAEQSTQTEQGEKIDVQEFTLTPPAENPAVQVVDNNQEGNGFIFQINFQLVINNPQQERDRFYDPDEDEIYYEQLSRGRIRETIVRPNGVKIVTVRNRNGDILKRSKILPDGREIILASVDDRDDDFILEWRDPGEDLPELRLTIPIREYILDADSADEDEIEFFLDQPPVEKVRRIYSIDEVKRSARIRDTVRRLEIGGLTFDSGKATIARDQVGALAKVAKAMLKILDRNPGEVFLIEGHTDAVGSDQSNLVLSDKRAATVAGILTEYYDIPAENLVTQGYGERYLKVKTEDAEELNRRVTIKDITSLISYQG
ncbi:MAG: OmpA family protein [Devosia sp.]